MDVVNHVSRIDSWQLSKVSVPEGELRTKEQGFTIITITVINSNWSSDHNKTKVKMLLIPKTGTGISRWIEILLGFNLPPWC